MRANGVSTYLSAQVHLQGAVDSHHIIVLANNHAVVDILRVQQHYIRIVIDKVIKPAATQDKGSDDATRVFTLLAVADGTGVVQVYQAIGKHLAVNAQILVPSEESQ